MAGQHTVNGTFGKALYFLAKEPKFKTFVDIGSWNGQGTTLCLYTGINEREDKQAVIHSFEINRKKFEEAQKFWKDSPIVKCYHGRVSERMMTPEEIQKHPLFYVVYGCFRDWYADDLNYFNSTPKYTIESCDVAVLDGGEFGGPGDLDAVLKMNPTVIALDDTKVMKNFDNCRRLESLGFTKIFSSDDGNGHAIYQRA